MTTRYAFTAAKILKRIGLKRYLMSRSTRLLYSFPKTGKQKLFI